MPVPNKIPVKCSVNSCEYWENNCCYASHLDVNNSTTHEAKSSDATCCETFKCKNS